MTIGLSVTRGQDFWRGLLMWPNGDGVESFWSLSRSCPRKKRSYNFALRKVGAVRSVGDSRYTRRLKFVRWMPTALMALEGRHLKWTTINHHHRLNESYKLIQTIKQVYKNNQSISDAHDSNSRLHPIKPNKLLSEWKRRLQNFPRRVQRKKNRQTYRSNLSFLMYDRWIQFSPRSYKNTQTTWIWCK